MTASTIRSLIFVFVWASKSWALTSNHVADPRSRSTTLIATATETIPYPRAAVSVAVRCEFEDDVYYLLVQRGKAPGVGLWSFPGGKLEIGETAMQGGKRELAEETKFSEQSDLRWHPETIATHDSIIIDEDGITEYHFLIAVCFAELPMVERLPKVKAADDADNARWCRIDDVIEEGTEVTPGLVNRMRRTEFLYEREVFQL